MIDFTKSTHITDAAGEKVRAEFLEQKGWRLVFRILEGHAGVCSLSGPCKRVFRQDGTHYFNDGLTLCPPEPETPEERPVWALKMACEAAGIFYGTYARGGYSDSTRLSVRAHALTLAKHVPEPTDPLVEAVKAALDLAEVVTLVRRDFDEGEPVGPAFIASLRKQGVTIGGDA